jgi:PhnB protein
MQINPYLYFDGQCEAAFKAYEQCLGGKIEAIMTYAQSPMEEPPPEGMADKIMHAHLVIGDQHIMGSDSPPQYLEKPQGFSVSLQLKDMKEAERIFNELSSGGVVSMPLQETFWAKGFAMWVDRFGTPWIINCE